MRLTPDLPHGVPSFDLSEDEMATVVDLICRAATSAKAELTPGLWEVPITVVVRKAMRRAKKELGLTNLEVRGEHEIENMALNDPSLLGRIDITMKFLRQFGDEDDYVAIECKRVGAGAAYSQLNGRYVDDGLIRFVNGQYAEGHAKGFMLGYVLSLPSDKILEAIRTKVEATFGEAAKLSVLAPHSGALAMCRGALTQHSGGPIDVRHIFVDMTTAAPAPAADDLVQQQQ